MKKIWKFKVPNPHCVIKMPSGAEILHVHTQAGTPCFWARVDPNSPEEFREFHVCPTGGDVPDHAQYLGTFHMHEGTLVFHLFEVKHP